jgi:hypothetical protein
VFQAKLVFWIAVLTGLLFFWMAIIGRAGELAYISLGLFVMAAIAYWRLSQ